MTKLRLKYIHAFKDRHGKPRHYFRGRDDKRVPLPGLPGSDEFMAAYQAALAGNQTPQVGIGASRTIPGTVAAAVASYFGSAAFVALAPETRRTRRNIINHIRNEHGDKRLDRLQRQHVEKMVAAKAGKPSAARNLIKVLRGLIAHAIALGMCTEDPTAGIKLRKVRTGGYLMWKEEHVTAYRQRHPLGTRERLALELLLNVGMRRGDLVRLGRQHLRDGEFSFQARKTRTPVDGIPLLPELDDAIRAMPSDHLTFLTTEYGRPFSAAGFGNWFRERCNEAGIPTGYSAHGLRKASATRLAERGATAHQLKAWFGWETLQQAELYTRAANNRNLARDAGKLLKIRTPSGKPS